jgi:diguanylate cyclase (GGDEF)-like protein/PAS domain S-box-containing protein
LTPDRFVTRADIAPPPPPSLIDRHPRAAMLGRFALLVLAALALMLAAQSVAGDKDGLMVGMGLVAGLGVAGHNRDGQRAVIAALLALLLGALATTSPRLPALAMCTIAGLSLVTVSLLLRRSPFDARLERVHDLLWLVLAAVGFALPLAAGLPLVGSLHEPEPGGSGGAQAVLVPGLLAAVGFLLTAVPTCSLTPSERRASIGRLLTVMILLLLLWGAVAAPWQDHLLPGPPVWWFVPFVALLALTAVAGTAVASLALLAAAFGLGLVSLHASDLFRGQALAMLVSLQVMLLLAHALRADATRREQRWEWALDGSRLGVADWRLAGGDSFVSAAWRSLAGANLARWTPEAWVDAVHADDREALRTALTQVSTGEVGRQRLELRMPLAAGWRWLEATLLVIERDGAGTPVRLLATLLDVDERHEAQESQRLSASLFQHLHEGLLITDAELRVLDANPAYTSILGVGRDEMLGSVPSLLRPSPADPLARQQRATMWSALRSSGGWRGELLERRRSGEMCTLQVTISSVKGPQGDVRFHVLVITDVTEQRVQRERLERQAHFDELTRLPNRARLSQLLDDAMRASDRDGYLLTVCYLDLDRFKPVNDRYGHAAGDRLLIELAGRLRSALRTRDTWADTAARLGGDEFVLLLRAETIEEARMAVERVLRVVAQPYVVDPAAEPVQVTASMGATVFPIDRSDADTLLRHADHAMYGAKQSGRNGYLFFDPEHRRRTEERVMAIGRVQEALDQAEFVLFYQPKVDMRAGRVLGFEALLRWDHPQHGLIAPMQFLPLIENTGLSSRVGDWVFAQALEHLSQWRRSGMDISVSVNVSARHLQESDFAQRLSELLARHAEPLAPHVELEMLETAAHADIEATSALMARCRALGVRFALDDFGTGYSTLTYLKRLPVDVLKIDRSFVHHMLDDAQDRAIVEGVIGLARTFGCVVVAEGVESPAQARTLLDLGCDIGQGTGIAAPMPAGQVAAWARHYKGMFALMPAAIADAAGGSGGAGDGASSAGAAP